MGCSKIFPFWLGLCNKQKLTISGSLNIYIYNPGINPSIVRSFAQAQAQSAERRIQRNMPRVKTCEHYLYLAAHFQSLEQRRHDWNLNIKEKITDKSNYDGAYWRKASAFRWRFAVTIFGDESWKTLILPRARSLTSCLCAGLSMSNGCSWLRVW